MNERLLKTDGGRLSADRSDGHDATLSTKPPAGRVLVQRGFICSDEVTPDMKLVALVYAAHANRHGLAWPGLIRLQSMTGLGRDVVKRARSSLVRLGLLTKRRIKTSDGKFSGVKYAVSEAIALNGCSRGTTPDHRTESQSCGEANSNTSDYPTSLHHRTEKPSDGKTVRRVFSPQNKNKKSTSMSVQNKNKPKSEAQLSEHPSRIDSDADKFKGLRSEGKTLAEVLDIDTSRIRNKERDGMHYLERAFEYEDPPKEREALAAWLDGKLKWMTDERHVFPKVVFLRLKQLQRGGFTRVSHERCDASASAADTIQETDVRRILRDHLRAVWESWTRPARGGSDAEKCRLFLKTAREKGFELNDEELAALERGASATNIGGES